MHHQASIFLVLLFGALLSIDIANATSLEPIWISPTNVNYTYDSDVLETFPVDKGVWTKLDIGSGPRGNTPGVVMDSKGILWLMFGAKDDSGSDFWYSVWNYNPKTDQFRYVWRSNGTNPRNAGELRVPAETNHPGSILSGGITIDNNDNIWLTSYQFSGEFWMFNTTSWMFTRMQGLAGTESERPSIGANPGQPGEDVWPGRYTAQCMLTDSQNNIWLLSGNNYNGISNSAWYFNTTSLLWTYITGTIVQINVKHNATFYSGTNDPGCFMDDNDRAWLYGGYGAGDDDYSHIWTFDTRTKREWEFEYGVDPYKTLPNVASDDFHPDNRPSAAEGSILVDRMDGTVMLVTGYGFNDQGAYGGTDTVWLYSKSLKQWKLFSGNISAINSEGVYVNYRQTGNRFPSIRYSAQPNGKNCNGDVYVVGSLNVDISHNRKDIWLIPQDQCTTGNHKCDVNAKCIEEMVGYSCECKQGYTGDGFTCTAPPINTPKEQTSGADVIVSSLLVIVFALL